MEKSLEEKFIKLTRSVAAEGIVLLKNNQDVLPLTDRDHVSVFGRCQIDYYRSGTGSGGAVNTTYSVHALEGLKHTSINLNEEMISLYETYIENNPYDNGNGQWGSEPWCQKEMILEDSIVKNASEVSNKALIFIGRTAGEDKDHYIGEGSLLLTKNELQMIDVVTRYFKRVVLIYNVGNVIDMSYLSQYNDKIDGILYAWQGGMEGGNALADILTGKVNPSGKLPDTITKDIQNYPTNKNFGDASRNFYEEDIYVGYRYFETFQKEQVLYPFGHGLSYTTFETSVQSYQKNNQEITIDFLVKNTGDVSGKEVIQVYAKAPQGVLGKPSIILVGFKKTDLIKPNDERLISINIPLYALSSYDDCGYTGNKSSYVLEKGTYHIYLGSNSRDMSLIDSFDIDKTFALKTLLESLAPITPFKRIKPGKKLSDGTYEITYEDVPLRTVDLEKRLLENLPAAFKQTKEPFNFNEVINKARTLEAFIGSLSNEQLALIVLGEGMSHPLVTPGTAAAFAGVYPALRDVGVMAACAADGPSGLRMDNGDTSIQMPIGTLIASTWNVQLIEELYTLEGQELYHHQVDTLLGPGMNIHRNPMCGRNFEYFSEDPMLTGKIAAAIVRGLRKGGSEATLKHFVANDQEAHRFDVDSIASERCLREIHLKGFEIAIKESNPVSVMTSYNPVNGHHAASNFDLNTTVLRQEWGFNGFVMTDWWAKMNHNTTPDKAEKYRVAEMVKAQNDLYMVIPTGETKSSLHLQEILKHLETGYLTLGELHRSVKNVLTFVLNSNAAKRQNKSSDVIQFTPLDVDSVDFDTYTSSIQFHTKENDAGMIYVNESKSYTVVVSMRNDASDLSQSACNININNQQFANVTLKGNTLETIQKDVGKVTLQKGFYNISLEFIKPGLEIKTITFK